jgi:hypothetical protein
MDKKEKIKKNLRIEKIIKLLITYYKSAFFLFRVFLDAVFLYC